MELTVPFREFINVVALGEAFVFAIIFLFLGLRGGLANKILAAVFFLLVTVKADQLFQFLGGLENYPQYAFVFIPIQWLVTPALYFFVRARVSENFKFKKQHLWNLVPATISLIYMWFFYFQLPVAGKIELLQSGVLRNTLNGFFIPLVADFIQLGYLLATLRVVNAHGITLKNWFSRIDDQKILWVKPVIFLWAVIFLFHVTLIISVGGFGVFPFGRGAINILNVLHLVMINALMFVGFASHFKLQANGGNKPRKKYAGSNQSGAERKTLFSKALKIMGSQKLFLELDLNLGQLADKLAATPRELSEAINGEGKKNFYDFVNSFRIEEAKQMLERFPEKAILEIGFTCGFNSKSTFNELFRKSTGQTPSQYRKKS